MMGTENCACGVLHVKQTLKIAFRSSLKCWHQRDFSLLSKGGVFAHNSGVLASQLEY